VRPRSVPFPSVIYSVGVFVTMFLAAMQILSKANINVGPPLGSGLAIAGLRVDAGKGFHQRLFILVENQYDIGDTSKIAGLQGTVESMTLRRNVLPGN
jgi:small-conductance mechanosensitive channel